MTSTPASPSSDPFAEHGGGEEQSDQRGDERQRDRLGERQPRDPPEPGERHQGAYAPTQHMDAHRPRARPSRARRDEQRAAGGKPDQRAPQHRVVHADRQRRPLHRRVHADEQSDGERGDGDGEKLPFRLAEGLGVGLSTPRIRLQCAHP